MRDRTLDYNSFFHRLLFTFFPSPPSFPFKPTMAALAHSRATAARCSMATPAVACSSSARSVASASSSRPAASIAALRAPRALPSLAAPRRAAAPARATRLACAAAKGYKVALLGAAGGIGQPLALLLKMQPYISQLALYDIANVKGVAADLSHCNTAVQVRSKDGVEGGTRAIERVEEEERKRGRGGKRATANCDGAIEEEQGDRSIDRRTEKENDLAFSLSLSRSLLELNSDLRSLQMPSSQSARALGERKE